MKKKELFKNIVAIRTAKNNAVFGGTGFFVKTEDNICYLVTANHVARDTTTETDIYLQQPKTGMPLAIKIRDLNSMVIWLYHPIADIAILEVKNPTHIDLSQYYLDIKSFESDFDNTPERECNLTMFGIPEVFSDLQLMPFTCDSKPASNLWVSHFDVTGANFKCFMLDKPSTQGFSGGPVFALDTENTKCYGIIHGTRQDNTGGKLAIVVHSAYLFELIAYSKQTK